MGDKTLMMTMLLDFYGELLTDRQRQCFTMHYNEDLSLGEIADIMNITRQGAQDLIARAEISLTKTESKIGLIKRFEQQRPTLEAMEAELLELCTLTQGRPQALAQNLLKELHSISN